jgi:hypothetical protein
VKPRVSRHKGSSVRAVSERLRPEMTRGAGCHDNGRYLLLRGRGHRSGLFADGKEPGHRLLVLDHDDKCVGLVSLSDLAAKAKSERLSGHVLAGVSAA